MKKPWQSKTHWTALLMAIVSFVPGVDEFISQHPQTTVFIQTAVMILLRWVSDGKIEVKKQNIVLPVMILAFFGLGIGSCQKNVVDPSELALTSGNATMVFGGCSRPMTMGYDVCQLTRGQKLPTLQLGFFNPGEYAVSDCRGGMYKSAAVEKAGVVDIDLSGIQAQADSAKACWLRIEAVEYYPDSKDPKHKRQIALAGGFIVEFLAPGYMPVPSEDLAAWCYQLSRTTSGRTEVKKCK